jgi:LysM repeat protein
MKSATSSIIKTAVISAFLLAACQAPQATQTTGASINGELIPYYTETAEPTATVTPLTAPSSTPQPTLTPTPGTYVTKENDTLWTIAAKNGLTVDELKAANPDVDPYNLRGGITLIIPAASGTSETQVAPTPTASSVKLGQPVCTPSLTGGLYCIVMVENNLDFDVQSLVVQFTLTDSASGDKAIQDGLLPLNRLTQGSKLPVFTYFVPPIPENSKVETQILSALPISSGEDKYLDLNITGMESSISEDGYSATMTGKISLADAGKTTTRYWLAAVAYDELGNVVAIRQLDKTAELSSNTPQDFSIYVYSIAGKIDHVDVFGEAAR